LAVSFLFLLLLSFLWLLTVVFGLYFLCVLCFDCVSCVFINKVMIVYLIRHTRLKVIPDLCYGQSEMELLDWHFERTVKRLKKQVLLLPRDTIYSSPLKRCVILAKALSKGPCRVKVDHRLMELNFGQWEMQDWNNIDDQQMLKWSEDMVNGQLPGGESYAQLYQRAGDFWQFLLQMNHEQTAVCTHGGIIKALLAHILEIPIGKSLGIQLHYGETIRIESKHRMPFLVEFLPSNT